MKLITNNPWGAITRAVRKLPGRCRIAVAYFGRGAANLLPLKQGSVLVIDFSEASVKSGRVDPAEVLRLIKHGVEVHSVSNLHAKVFVAGQTVFIGSTNASQSSAGTLIEALAQTRDKAFVRQATAFVESLRGEHITPEHARQMEKLYKPPAWGTGRPRTRKARSTASAPTPTHARTWVTQLKTEPWTDAELAAEGRGYPIAKRQLKSTRRFDVEDFAWSKADFARRVKKHDLVVQVTKGPDRRIVVSPPERVLHIQAYSAKKGVSGSVVFTEEPRGLRHKTLAQVRKALGRDTVYLRRKSYLTLLDAPIVVHRLFQLWPNLSS